jgi:hypothetical protein
VLKPQKLNISSYKENFVTKKILIPFLETSVNPFFAGSTSASQHVTFTSEKKNKNKTELSF